MKFTKKAFAAWLSSMPSRKRVGDPEHVLTCPLCQFLKEQGAKSVVMGITSRTVDGVRHENPRWAATFQRLICLHVDNDSGKTITAGTALRYLNA